MEERRFKKIVIIDDIDLNEEGRAALRSMADEMIEYRDDSPVPEDEIIRRTGDADALFVSTPHMIRVFRKETGQTPHKYLLEYRLRAAAQLLKYSDLSTAQIASSAGFSSASHFIRCFRKAHGVTPAHYRTAARQNAGVQKGDSHGS